MGRLVEMGPGKPPSTPHFRFESHQPPQMNKSASATKALALFAFYSRLGNIRLKRLRVSPSYGRGPCQGVSCGTRLRAVPCCWNPAPVFPDPAARLGEHRNPVVNLRPEQGAEPCRRVRKLDG